MNDDGFEPETPIRVVGQRAPQAGPVITGRGWESSPLMVDPRVVEVFESNGDFEALGIYMWMSREQHLRHELTVATLAARMGGSVVDAQAVIYCLAAAGLVRSEPGQAERLSELADLEALFDERAENRAKKARAAAAAALAQPAVAPPTPPKPRTPTPPPPRVDRHEPNADGEWTGTWPLSRDSSYPARGENVVYVLRETGGLVVYVGSTNDFRSRMKAHQSAGKRWATWTAHQCESREEAYRVETEYLQMHMPHLNVAGPRIVGGAE